MKLHNSVPIPWQSKPIFGGFGGVFNVIEENEQRIYLENICGYCGLKFNNDDYCLRWIGLTDKTEKPNNKKGPKVFSDTHPLHPECMKQARIFCPYMRSRLDEEFESGTYKELRYNSEIYLQSFGIDLNDPENKIH